MNKIKALITSGGTKIKVDIVRSITNMSKGTFGSRIATEASFADIDVDFLHAVDSKMPKENPFGGKIEYFPYVTFDDYAQELDKLLFKQPEIIILAAAVSDYGVENYVDGKIRSGDSLTIKLKPLPKLISTVREKCPNSILCGFKLLVNSAKGELCDACRDSLEKNKCDIVVGNDLRDIKNDDHKLLIVKKDNRFDFNIFINSYSSKDNNLAKIVIDECLDLYKGKLE